MPDNILDNGDGVKNEVNVVPALMELIFLPHYLESNLNSSSSIFSNSPMLWVYFFFLSKDIPTSKKIGRVRHVLSR